MGELVYGWDAAFCPDPVPAEAGGFRMSYGGFYLGGSSAFHTWDAAERARLGLSGQKAMPIWVPTPGHENPRQVGLEVASAMRAAGIPAGARPWRVCMWDMETGVEPDGPWLQIAANALESRGYGSLVYGSVVGSGLFSYPPRTGYMVAFPNGRPSLYPHPDVVGTQFQFAVTVPGGEVDLDAIEPSLLDHLGVLPY